VAPGTQCFFAGESLGDNYVFGTHGMCGTPTHNLAGHKLRDTFMKRSQKGFFWAPSPLAFSPRVVFTRIFIFPTPGTVSMRQQPNISGYYFRNPKTGLFTNSLFLYTNIPPLTNYNNAH